MPIEPATSSARPKQPLCACFARDFINGRTSSLQVKKNGDRVSSIAHCESWISSICSSPTNISFSANSCDSLGNCSVSVSVASTISCSAGSLSPPNRPDGISIATTSLLQASMPRMTLANTPFTTGRSSPLPKSASITTTSAASAGIIKASATSVTGTPAACRRSRFTAQSGDSLPFGLMSHTATSQPAPCSIRATARPSPPLLPGPANTANERPA